MEISIANNADSASGLNTVKSGVAGGFDDGLEMGLEGSPNVLRKEERLHTFTGFQEGDLARAIEQRDRESNRYYKGKLVETPVSLPFFRMYGSGIYLFFSFLYQISILFLILTVISIIPITINTVKGTAFLNSESSLQYFITKSSIGSYQYTQKVPYQQSINYKIANVVIDIFTAVLFLAFLLYWESKSKKIVREINTKVKLLSSTTLEVTGVPDGVTEARMADFMGSFGDVTEVAAVRNYQGLIQTSKSIYEIKLKIKQLQLAAQLGQQPTACQQIQCLTTQCHQLESLSQSASSSSTNSQKILKFYIQFDKPEHRDQIYQKFKPFQKIFKCCQDVPPPEMLLDNQMVQVKLCDTQPTGIIWENVHVTWRTRWMRMLLQFFIILSVVAGGFLLIAFLNVLVPPTKETVDTTAYNWTTIQTETNTTLVESWCIKSLSFSTTSYQSLCYSYWKSYIFSILIKIGIAATIIVLKAIIKIIMIYIAKFQRYTTHTEQSVAIMTNLLITYMSTTVMITFLMQANVFKISFKSIISHLIKDKTLLDNLSQMAEYYDLTSNWYRDIGYQIWFNVFILGFVPHVFMPIVLHALEWFNLISAKGQKMYRNMYQKIRPAQFQIQQNYANILMIIMIGFVFGGGSPCMIVVSFIGLCTRYVYFKYIFVRFCRVPKTFNSALNQRAISVMRVVLIVRCLISLYMYGADGIFAMEKSTFMKWTETLELPLFSSIFVVVSRVFLTWYYSMFIVAFIAIYVFKQLLINNLIKLCRRETQENKMQQSIGQLKDDQIISQRSLTKSYKLENNPDYIEILAIMKLKFRTARESISPVAIKNS